MNLIKLLLIIISVLTIPRGALSCYSSIINFGDSLSDTGNFILSKPSGTSRTEYNWLNPPNGETFFHSPTGRCSDGRLIIDFIAESLGFPLITPYLEIKKNLTVENFERGVNFAVVASTALDTAYLEELGTPTIITNCSLRNQMGWFKDMLVSLCNTSSPSECSRQLLSSSLVSMGIGSNDYNSPLLVRRLSAEKILSYLPLVIEKIALAINELIEFGASTFLVSGTFPNGCLPAYQEVYANSTADEYNTTNGCLNWLNVLAEYHNEQLQIELSRIRSLNPHVNLIYTDYYHAMLQLIESPEEFGFNGETKFIACCGAGGNRNNFKDSAWCGQENVKMYVCENPKQFISWDGGHATEATYRWMAKGVLEGKYNNPPNPISTLCFSQV